MTEDQGRSESKVGDRGVDLGRGVASGEDDISFIEFANILLRQRRLLVLMPVALFSLVAMTLALPRTYSAVGTFVPNASDGPISGAAGLAAQFGISLQGSSDGRSPDFYAELLRSREILGRVIDHSYEFTMSRGLPFFRDTTTVRGSLIDVFEIEEESLEKGRARAIRKLGNMISVSVGRLSGTVTITAKTLSPALSQQITHRMLELVDEFNRTRRQSQAAAERKFVEERLLTTREELREAERALQEFLQANRLFDNSPELTFEHERLQRDVAMHQEVYTSLRQSYEQSRIDEVRNTPVITVLQQPDLPVLPDRRRLVIKGLIALMLGGILGVVAAFGREIVLSKRQDDAEGLAEFQALKRDSLRDLRRPWRLLRRPSADK